MKRVTCQVVFVSLFISLMMINGYAADHQATLKALRADISANGYHYTVKYNPACDIPLDQLCTLRPEWAAASDIMLEEFGQTAVPVPGEGISREMALPTSYTGYCGGIRNQGPYGTCWAFASVGVVESTFQDGDNLSEQHLIDCNSAGYNQNGGWFWFAEAINPGLCYEADYPYVGPRGSCKEAPPYHDEISNAYYVSGYPYPSVDNIKQKIYDKGAVAAAVYVNSAFQYYNSGCFSSCRDRTCNHAILLCGWNDSDCSGYGAWKLKNSWGPGWGENGYMWIRYGCSRVGYAACYVVL